MTTKLIVSVPGNTIRNAIGEVPDGVEIVEWNFKTDPPLPHIDLVIPPNMGSNPLLSRLSAVTTRLVQSQAIGYDRAIGQVPPGHIFANAASVHEPGTAELALGLILAAQRDLPAYVRSADRGEWKPTRTPGLADHRVLLVGYGGVNRAIEQRLLPFEVSITRVANTARNDELGHIHSIDEVSNLLPNADIVVIGVPLTEQTTRLVDAEFLRAMPDGALLVNIARGKVVDTDAMLAEAERLRFALDVTDPEPLPDGHPLFEKPNVLISPHVGGATRAMMPRLARLVHEQIDRMLAGREPLNVVLRT